MTVGSKSGRTGDDGKAEAQGLEKKVYDYAVTRNGYEPKRECGFARWR